MLSSGETKYLAIAAACGVAVGAVAGAVGYAAFTKTPLSSRRNSVACLQCSPQHTSPLHAGSIAVPAVSSNGDGTSFDAMAGPDPSQLLEELSNRIASLELAIKSKLLSKSGTNLSSGGYLTANELSDDESDEEFQDVTNDSGDEIFFHSSTSPKRVQPKPVVEESVTVASVTSPVSSSAVTGSIDYADIDRCLCSDLPEDNDAAYTKLSDLHQSNTSNPEFLWRYAKAVHQKNLASSDIHMKKDFAYRAKDLAFAALACDGGDGIADVHKWCAITVGNIGDYVSIQMKISNGCIFKERIDAAIRLNSRDEMSQHLLGRWCFSVYMMSWIEKKMATSLVPNFPKATIDEALNAFQLSEAIKPNHWIDNQLYLAKCYIQKKDYTAAVLWLDEAAKREMKPEDADSMNEVRLLLKSYKSYRKPASN